MPFPDEWLSKNLTLQARAGTNSMESIGVIFLKQVVHAHGTVFLSKFLSITIISFEVLPFSSLLGEDKSSQKRAMDAAMNVSLLSVLQVPCIATFFPQPFFSFPGFYG